MGLGGILQRLRTEGALVLYHDYRLGHAQDLSGNGNNGTPTSGVIWQKGSITFPAFGQTINVVDNASIRISNGTVLVFGDFVSQATNECYVARSNGAAACYWLYMDSSPNLRFNDGTVVRTVAANIVGKNSIAVTWTAGNVPFVYLNGVYSGFFNGTVSPSVVAGTTLEIGNLINNNRLRSPLKAAIIINRELSAAEHMELYYDVARFR